MMNLETFTAFFGWALTLNIGFLAFTSLMLFVFRDGIAELHSKMTGVPRTELNVLYFKYLSNYKIVTLAFFLVPYLALRIIA
uniref:DUF6868 family protein n=1 Tax=Thaumasiovibrio occultus TaxID=1891184 RepID=UPI000B35FBE0|nr:hypothetical protein [Thaumasiovibrio occultus]